MHQHEHTKTHEELGDVYEKVPATYWDDSYKNNRLQKLYYDIRFKIINDLLADVPEQGSVLDVGCASGFSIDHYAKARPDVSYAGADVAPHHIEYAQKERPQHTFKTGPAEALPYEDNTFDSVTMLDVIEHVVDVDACLAEMKRVLKPGGTAIIFVVEEHNPLFQVIWWIWLKTKGKVWEEAHLREYTKESLAADVKKVGFTVEDERRSHGTMGLAIKARKQ